MSTSISTEHQTVATAFLERLIAGDLVAAVSHVHADAVISEPASLPFGGEFHGHAGYMQFLEGVTQTIEFQVHDHSVQPVGDQILVQLQTTMAPRQGGEAITMPVIEIYSFTAGLISRFDVFYKDTKALTDALQRATA